MTTTEPKHGDIYSLLEELPQVAQITEHTQAWIDKVKEITEEVRSTLLHAKDVLAMHEAQASIVVDHFTAAVSDERIHGLADALHEVIGVLSGSQDLHLALQGLSELADPDNGLTPDEVNEAKRRLENGEVLDR